MPATVAPHLSRERMWIYGNESHFQRADPRGASVMREIGTGFAVLTLAQLRLLYPGPTGPFRRAVLPQSDWNPFSYFSPNELCPEIIVADINAPLGIHRAGIAYPHHAMKDASGTYYTPVRIFSKS